MTAAGENRWVFGRNASVLLDVLRFAAAIAVALTHLGGIFVQTGPLIWQRAGNSAVCIFFVLSGFVIRYVTTVRDTTAKAYAIDRASRIYSVVVPCLLLTVLLEAAASIHAPGVYRRVAMPGQWGLVPGELLQNLTFTVGWWGWGSPPLSNGPFWSLSFECVFYALYGFLRYLPRARWVLVPLLLLAAGPSIALLFPVWLLGAWLYDGYAALSVRRDAIAWSSAGLVTFLAGLWFFRIPVQRALQATSVSARTDALTRMVARYGWGRALFHGGTVPWLNRFSVSYFLTGSLLALALLPVLLMLDRWAPPANRAGAHAIRLVADSTFTLYLFHMPLFILLVSLKGDLFANWREGWAVLAFAVVSSIGLAKLFDRLKETMRSGLRRNRITRQAQAATP